MTSRDASGLCHKPYGVARCSQEGGLLASRWVTWDVEFSRLRSPAGLQWKIRPNTPRVQILECKPVLGGC